MRTQTAFCVALVGATLAASPAFAGGDHLFSRVPGEDPYAYRFTLPRYYPYYNSGYWVPREHMRYRYRYDTVLPPYQSSWGYPLPPHAKVVTWRERYDRRVTK